MLRIKLFDAASICPSSEPRKFKEDGTYEERRLARK